MNLLKRAGTITRPNPSALALRQYFVSDLDLHRVVVSYDRPLVPGYAWIVPVGNRTFNVGCGVTLTGESNRASGLKNKLTLFLDRFPLGRELMRTGKPAGPVQGAPLRCGLSGLASAVHGRTVAVGEALGTTFPFTGEGIGKALHSGQLAAECLDQALTRGSAATLSCLDAVLERELKPLYAGYSVAQRWLSRPWLNDFVARRVRGSAYLRQQVNTFMAHTGDPRVLSLIHI